MPLTLAWAFHVSRDGETLSGVNGKGMKDHLRPLSDFDAGLLIGVLIGEGHFGGDGRQPQVTLRMHVRHEALFRWLERTVPGSRLYGPYVHGDRHYYQWMVRGRALVEGLLPLLESQLTKDLDGYAAERVATMLERYAEPISRARRRAAAASEAGL